MRDQEKWDGEYYIFSGRETFRAAEADIPGFITAEDRSAHLAVPFRSVGNKWSQRLFDGPFLMSESRSSVLPAVNLVFVEDTAGNTGAENPGDLGGGQTDHHLIYKGLSRAAADGVLAGANTVRGSRMILSVWHPEMVALRSSFGLARHPAQIVATESGKVNLDQELMFNIPSVPAYLLTTERGKELLLPQVGERPWVKIIATGDALDFAAALSELRSKGISRVSAIGGRTVATALIDSGLIQDLYLTTSSILAGEPNTPFYIGEKGFAKTLVLRKLGRGPEEGVVFQHFILQ